MTVTDTHDPAIQRRTLRVLLASVVPAGMGMAGAFAATAVLAKEITGSDRLAGVAAATVAVGGALATVPLANYTARHGRRPGLRLGWSVAAVGGGLAFLAAIVEFYPLLLLGVAGIGVGNVTSLAARYAAADLAPEDARASAIGFLVWGGTIGSVLGPTVALGPAGWVALRFGLPELAGPYMLSLLVFASAGYLVNRLLLPDPLVLAGGLLTTEDATARRPPLSAGLKKIWTVPAARLAVFAMLMGQAVMVAVMTMTPVHMKNGSQELRVIGLVISVHILGMYAFSPLVGWLVDRVGTRVMIATGGTILFLGAQIASRTDPADRLGVFVGLFLIGLGWSFGLISGSALLTSAFDAGERVSIQGAADLIMVGSGALGGLTSGFAVGWVGFANLSQWAGFAALIMVLAAGWATLIAMRTPKPIAG